jgi:hypothetical protein
MQIVAPALSAHCHSPSSGMRGWLCQQLSSRQTNGGALVARLAQVRAAPLPTQRQPIADAGVGVPAGSGRVTTRGPPRSQQTRSVSTSAQSPSLACDPGAGAGPWQDADDAISATRAARAEFRIREEHGTVSASRVA